MNVFTVPPVCDFLESFRRSKSHNRQCLADILFVVCWVYDLTIPELRNAYVNTEFNLEIPTTGPTYAKAEEQARIRIARYRRDPVGSSALRRCCQIKIKSVESTLLRIGIDYNLFISGEDDE